MIDEEKIVRSGKITLQFDCVGDGAGECYGIALALIRLMNSKRCVKALEVTCRTAIGGDWDGSPGTHFVGDDASLQITMNEHAIFIEWET